VTGSALTQLFCQFTSVKFIILMLVMVFVLRYFNVFYQGLLNRYRRFADEQVR